MERGVAGTEEKRSSSCYPLPGELTSPPSGEGGSHWFLRLLLVPFFGVESFKDWKRESVSFLLLLLS